MTQQPRARKVLWVLLKIVLFLVIYVGAQAFLKFMILNDTLTISRVMMHDLYTETENIDVLFVGASHCQLGMDPELLDQSLGLHTFNAGSSEQGLETSLALIREANSKNELKEVYLDLDYSVVMRQNPNLESIYIISDYMKPSLRKVSYLIGATEFDYYPNSFLPFHLGRGYLHNPSAILTNIKTKLSPGYLDYTRVDGSYAGRGHISSYTAIDNGSFWTLSPNRVESYDIPDKQYEMLDRIISYCEKEQIKLTLICIPVTDFYLEQLGNYDEYVDTIKAYAKEKQVDFYDFNLCKTEFLPLTEDRYFNDDNHLNHDGNQIWCKTFGDFFSGKISAEDLFYDSYREKLENTPAKISGLVITGGADGSLPTVTPVSNRENIDATIEILPTEEGYEITATYENEVTNHIWVIGKELQ